MFEPAAWCFLCLLRLVIFRDLNVRQRLSFVSVFTCCPHPCTEFSMPLHSLSSHASTPTEFPCLYSQLPLQARLLAMQLDLAECQASLQVRTSVHMWDADSRSVCT